MSQKSSAQWKKGQNVEVYEPSQRRWITGNIHDIIYCVEYQEYSKEIHHKDAHSLMRIPQNNQQSANSDNEIAPKFPTSLQMEDSSKDTPRFNIQRMISFVVSVHRESLMSSDTIWI